MCFAYKIKKAIKKLEIQFVDPVTLAIGSVFTAFQSVADNQWHYDCVDIYAAYKAQLANSYTQSSLRVYQVNQIFKKFLRWKEITSLILS